MKVTLNSITLALLIPKSQTTNMHIASLLRVGFWKHQNESKDTIQALGESFEVVISKHLIKLF